MHPDQIQAVLALLADISARIAELQPMLTAMLPPTERQPLRVIEGGKSEAPSEDWEDALVRMFEGVR